MLELRHFLDQVIRPTLRQTAHHEAWNSETAVALVLGTAAAESRLTALVQHGGGPARGLYQMEPDTTRWLWGDYLARQPDLRERIQRLAAPGPDVDEQVAGNLYLATALCRLRYWTDPEPLPGVDCDALGEVWKRVYNTEAGAGTLDHWRQAWSAVVKPALIG